MWKFFSKTTPDPFRFFRPQFRSWAWPLFRLENHYHLYSKFHFRHVLIDQASLDRLCQQVPGDSHLVMGNHINFCDPHIIFEAFNRVKRKVYWLAGIDPFTKSRFVAWHMQSVGAMSVERGSLDRRAFLYAQQTLDEAQYPLVIFPEGEARFRSKTLGPFFSGATLFAINSALKSNVLAAPESEHTEGRRVWIWPMTITAHFVDNPTRQLIEACHALADHFNLPRPFQRSEGIHHLHVWHVLEHFSHLLQRKLAKAHGVVINHRHTFAENTMLVQLAMLQTLCQEHAPHILPSMETVSDYEPLMELKNKLFSIITRKLNGPTLAEVNRHFKQVEALQLQLNQQRLSFKKLDRLEDKLLGLTYSDDPPQKRLNRLSDHLKLQEPYATAKTHATPEDVQRWKDQQIWSRQLKMLYLISEDLKRHDDSWEGLDELLVKLEIGAMNAFVYRGPKDVRVTLGDPIDVCQWLKDQSTLSKKEQIPLLTELIRSKIDQRLDRVYPNRYVSVTSSKKSASASQNSDSQGEVVSVMGLDEFNQGV